MATQRATMRAPDHRSTATATGRRVRTKVTKAHPQATIVAEAAKEPTAKAVKGRATNKLNPTHHTVRHLVSRMVRRDHDGPTLNR
jgi:hypothetical protein